jgi:flagellar FliL protein
MEFSSLCIISINELPDHFSNLFNIKESPAMADDKAPKKPEILAVDPGAKKKKLIIIGGAALVLLIALGVTAFFLLKKHEPGAGKEKHGEPATEVHVPELNPPAAIGPMIEIKDFIVNIISEGERHYVKAAITIELIDNPAVSTGTVSSGGAHGGSGSKTATGNDLAKEEAAQRMPQIRDSILLLIGNKTYEELQDLQGKKQLKAELTSKLNSILHNGKVKEIYFTDFVVQ